MHSKFLLFFCSVLRRCFPVRLPHHHSSSVSDLHRPVILCIGSTHLTGDALGPLTGSLLTAFGCTYPVYGTLTSPVHAQNLSSCLKIIRTQYPHRPLLVIDAALGPEASVGSARFHAHGIKPGAGVGKDLGITGDFSITGIVGDNRIAPCLALTEASRFVVADLALAICAQLLLL